MSNLSRLTKPPLYTHVHFHNRRPGSLAEWAQSGIKSVLLDPSHPATKLRQKQFPTTKNAYFRLRAIPAATLMEPEIVVPPSRVKIDLWGDRVARASGLQQEHTLNFSEHHSPSTVSPHLLKFVTPPVLVSHPQGSIPMMLFFTTSKARTHKHCVIRRKLRIKVKEAINLIVTRGATVRNTSSNVKELSFDDEEVRRRGDKWLLPDWAYVCCPEAKIYLAPYSELVQAMRKSLQQIWDAGMRLEEAWAEAEKQTQSGLPLFLPNEAFYQTNGGSRSLKGRREGVRHKARLLH